MQGRRMFVRGAAAVTLAIGFLFTATAPIRAQEREIKVGYMKNPIQDASLDIMEKWAKANNVKLTRIPMAYSAHGNRHPLAQRVHLRSRRLVPPARGDKESLAWIHAITRRRWKFRTLPARPSLC